ncbi:MAG: S26 family signal peptidase, partial [Anaerolineales bacterium]|nr:S26 family signal peptidase [Anaerolineales bacterium]
MNPTLVEPELLEIQPYANRAPRVGDVIYFHAPDERDIVHRVVAILPDGIRTRGDNNPRDDPWLVSPNAIVGRVVAAQRGNARRGICSGRAGIAQLAWLRVWRRVNRRVSRVLHAPYRALARSGIPRKLLPARWRPRVVAFQ